jgi:hypothetical protein
MFEDKLSSKRIFYRVCCRSAELPLAGVVLASTNFTAFQELIRDRADHVYRNCKSNTGISGARPNESGNAVGVGRMRYKTFRLTRLGNHGWRRCAMERAAGRACYSISWPDSIASS